MDGDIVTLELTFEREIKDINYLSGEIGLMITSLNGEVVEAFVPF